MKMRSEVFAKLLSALVIGLFLLYVEIQADLNVEDVNEGTCLPHLTLLSHLTTEFPPFKFVAPQTFYVPMGSQALYRHYATALLGRAPKTQEELDAMKLEIYMATVPPVVLSVHNTGYKSKFPENSPVFRQACMILGMPNIFEIFKGSMSMSYVTASCAGFAGSDGTDINAFNFAQDSMIWTDDDATALVYRCPKDGIQDWKVISTRKNLTEETITIIKGKIMELGFSEKNVAFMSYDR